MYLKECRCGKSKKNFKFDIGPFFINKCCKDAGYDVHGNLAGPKAQPEPKKEEAKPEPVKSVMDSVKKAVSPKKKAPARKKKSTKKAAPKSEE